MNQRRMVTLDAKTLARARASKVLAIDTSVFASGVSIGAAEPETTDEGEAIAVVAVAGPLAQRGFADLCGFVDGYDRVEARFRAALNDPAVGALILAIDSPGGDVAGLEEAVTRMRSARDQSGKPVYVYVDELAASAAYWIACAVGTEVYAPPSALVGSIGCIGAVVDETKALEAEGIKVTLIRDPEGKAEGHPAGPVSELAENRARTLVRSASGRFFAAVSAARGIDAKQFRALNGAVLEAPEALKAGLIDGVASRDQVVQRAAAAVRERQKRMTDQDKAAAQAAANDKIAATVRALTGKDTDEAMIGALHATFQAAGRVVEMEKRIAEEAARASAAEKTTLIASLQKDRKLAKTQVAWAESLSLEALKAFAEVAQPLGGTYVPDAKGGEQPVDAELLRALELTGMSVEEHRQLQAEMKAKGI